MQQPTSATSLSTADTTTTPFCVTSMPDAHIEVDVVDDEQVGVIENSVATNDDDSAPNGIMLVAIAIQLGTPIRHAYLRSAGTTGALVFERAVEEGRGVACAIRPFNSEVTTAPLSSSSAAVSGGGGGRLTSIPPLSLDVDRYDELQSPPSSTTYSPASSLFVPVHLKNILLIMAFLSSSAQHHRRRYRDNNNITIQQQYPVHTLLLNDSLRRMVFAGLNPTGLGVSCKVLPDTLEIIGESSLLNDLIVLLKPRVVSQSRGPRWGEEGDGNGSLTIPLTFNVAILNDGGEMEVRGGGSSTAASSRADRACEEIHLPNLHPIHASRTIPSNYLSGFQNLKSIDLSPFKHMTVIQGGSFLKNCIRLKEINLTPFQNLEDCGSLFLAGCSGLTSPDLLAPMRNLRVVKSSFLYGCSSIAPTIHLGALHRLTTVNPYFLSGCSRLAYLDLSPFSRNTVDNTDNTQNGGGGVAAAVTSIGSYFLSGCSGLESIDLTPLSRVSSIGRDFMSGCGKLAQIDITPIAGALKEIPPSFLARTGLTTLDLSPLHNVTTVIGADFLSGCTSLTTINLSPLEHSVVEVHPGFLEGCTQLPDIDLVFKLPHATTV